MPACWSISSPTAAERSPPRTHDPRLVAPQDAITIGRRKVARADEWGGLESRCGLRVTVGSNPTPSASRIGRGLDVGVEHPSDAHVVVGWYFETADGLGPTM